MARSVSRIAARGSVMMTLACFAAASLLPQFAATAEAREKLSREQRKELERDRKLRNSIDKVIELAHKDGNAIVIVGTLGFKHKYPTEALVDENLADEVVDTGTSAAIDLSMAVEWTNVEDPDLMLAVGQQLKSSAIGPSGFYYRFEGQKADYLVYIAAPGTYSLSRISFPKPRSSFADGHGIVGGRGFGSIGELRQVASNILEAEQTTVFLNAATTTVAASEQCNWWYKGTCTQSVYTPEHTKQTRAAGFYPKTEYLPIPALDIGIKFNDVRISFEVAPGEVVLVDNLFPEPLDTKMAATDCRKGESMQICKLQSIDLTRAGASMDELRAFDFVTSHFPRLGKLIVGARYRPLEINAASLGKSKFGERYRIAAQR